MTFPPPVLPAAFDNDSATPEVHPEHHNDLADAVNSMVPVLQGAQAAISVPGSWICSPHASRTDQADPVVNRLHYTPIWIPRTWQLFNGPNFGIELIAGSPPVFTAPRVGVYTSTASLLPGARIASGQMPGGSGGDMELDVGGVDAVDRPAGLYYLAFCNQGGTTSKFRGIELPGYSLPMIGDTGFLSPTGPTRARQAFVQEGIVGALPANAAAGVINPTVGPVPLVFMRLA